MKIKKVLIHWHDEFPADPVFILLLDAYDSQYCERVWCIGGTPDYAQARVTTIPENFPDTPEDLKKDEAWTKLEMAVIDPVWLDENLQAVSHYRVYKNALGSWLPYDPDLIKYRHCMNSRKHIIGIQLRELEDTILPMTTLDSDPKIRDNMGRLLHILVHSWTPEIAQIVIEKKLAWMFKNVLSLDCHLCRGPITKDNCVLVEAIPGFPHPSNLFRAHQECRDAFMGDSISMKEARKERLDAIHRIFSRTQSTQLQLAERKTMAEISTEAFRKRTTLEALKMVLGVKFDDPRDVYEIGRDHARIIAHLLPGLRPNLNCHDYRDLRKGILAAEDWIKNPKHYPEWYLKAAARRLKTTTKKHRRRARENPRTGYALEKGVIRKPDDLNFLKIQP